jgi:hypothetical protein
MAAAFGQRPYSEPGATLGNSGRTAQFSTGQTGDPGNIAASASQDPGLNLNSAQFNGQVSAGVGRPTSVLQNVMPNPGGNGMSAGQAARRFADGTPIGNPNGIAADQLERAALLRMTGQDTGIT